MIQFYDFVRLRDRFLVLAEARIFNPVCAIAAGIFYSFEAEIAFPASNESNKHWPIAQRLYIGP